VKDGGQTARKNDGDVAGGDGRNGGAVANADGDGRMKSCSELKKLTIARHVPSGSRVDGPNQHVSVTVDVGIHNECRAELATEL
jgi:hypothetical protein